MGLQKFVFDKTLGLFVKTNGLVSKGLFGGLGHIFMLHRVLPERLRNQYSINRDLAITPEHLEWTIQYFKDRNYEFLSLDRLHQILESQTPPKKKFVCLTLDDGYLDNYIYGLPVFQKYNVPVTIYVTNCFPNNTAILWWYLLEDVILNQNSFEYVSSSAKETFNWQKDGQIKMFNVIRERILKTSASEFREMIQLSFKKSDEDLRQICAKEALTWEQVQTLSRHPLVTIGAHTMNHYCLSVLNEADCVYEMQQSKKEIEERINKPVHHFAYPYGGFAQAFKREYDKAGRLGFKTSVINFPGNIFLNSKQQTQSLPRMPLANSTTAEKLHHISTGINHFSYNGFSRLVNFEFR